MARPAKVRPEGASWDERCQKWLVMYHDKNGQRVYLGHYQTKATAEQKYKELSEHYESRTKE